MTDGELIDVAHTECSKLLKSEKGYNGISFPEFWAEGYKKGLTEGKPKWHDLRKDPNDLPHDETQVLIINNFDGIQYYLGYFDNFHGDWLSERALKLFDVIAWCELPEFKE